MTIEDVAKLSGLSKSTVSRYLNGGSVSKKSAAKIQKVIEETGFKTNIFAQRLKTNKSYLIGVLVDGIQSTNVTNMLRGINHVLRENNYQPFFMFDDYDKKNKIISMKALIQQGVDGIIFGTSKLSAEYLKFIHSLDIPVLIIGQKTDSLPYCKINDSEGGKLLGTYINTLDATRITYISMPKSDLAAGKERLEGFLSAISDEKKVNILEVGYDWEEAYNVAKKVVDLKPDIIVGASDNLSLGILQYLGENPEIKKIKIAGFGDYPFGALPLISLTTVFFNYYELGKDAGSKIIKLVNGEEIPHSNDNYSMELKIRNSTK